jgi:predicted RNA-binding protein with PIN domain
VTFLIDGYNLMFALGLASKKMSAKKFEMKRREFLDWLAKESKGRGATMRVVFDAQQAISPSPESEHKGVQVRFAYRETADDEIEKLLAAEPHPEAVTVVSNDSRIRAAGEHRGCATFSCEAFTDWLTERQPTPRPQSSGPPEKPDGPAAEDEELLKVFSVPKLNRKQ